MNDIIWPPDEQEDVEENRRVYREISTTMCDRCCAKMIWGDDLERLLTQWDACQILTRSYRNGSVANALRLLPMLIENPILRGFELPNGSVIEARFERVRYENQIYEDPACVLKIPRRCQCRRLGLGVHAR